MASSKWGEKQSLSGKVGKGKGKGQRKRKKKRK